MCAGRGCRGSLAAPVPPARSHRRARTRADRVLSRRDHRTGLLVGSRAAAATGRVRAGPDDGCRLPPLQGPVLSVRLRGACSSRCRGYPPLSPARAGGNGQRRSRRITSASCPRSAPSAVAITRVRWVVTLPRSACEASFATPSSAGRRSCWARARGTEGAASMVIVGAIRSWPAAVAVWDEAEGYR